MALSRDATKDAYAEDLATPRDGEVLFLCDFKEHDTLPRGPVEAGSWWYAGSRLSVTILTFLVWSKKRRDYLHDGPLQQNSWPSPAPRAAKVL